MSEPHHTSALDAVRASAAIAVFISHVLQIFLLPLVGLGSVLHLANSFLSECAVIVFFILSGYLISLSIFNNRQRNDAFEVLPYARSRFLRIYPPFLLSLLICAAIVLLAAALGLPGIDAPLRLPSDVYVARDDLRLSWAELRPALLLNGGFLDMNGPLWSLYIEAKLYVLAGAVAVAWGSAARGVLFAVYVAIAAALFLFIARVGIAFQPDFLSYSAWWLLGAAFFWCRGNRALLVGAILILAAAIVGGSAAGRLVEMGRVLLLCAFSYLIFYTPRSAPQVLVRAASFSYTLYLTHFPMLLLFYSLFVALDRVGLATIAMRVIIAIAAAALTFALAWSMRWLEDARITGALLFRPAANSKLGHSR